MSRHWVVDGLLKAIEDIDSEMAALVSSCYKNVTAIDVTQLRAQCEGYDDLTKLCTPAFQDEMHIALGKTRYPASLTLACYLCGLPLPTFKGEGILKLTNDPIPYLSFAMELVLRAPWQDIPLERHSVPHVRVDVVSKSAELLNLISNATVASERLGWEVVQGLCPDDLSVGMQMKRGVYVDHLMQIISAGNWCILEKWPDRACRLLSTNQPNCMTLATVLVLQECRNSNRREMCIDFPEITMRVAVVTSAAFPTVTVTGCTWLQSILEWFVSRALAVVVNGRSVPMIVELARTTKFCVACTLVSLNEKQQRFVLDYLLPWLQDASDQAIVATAIRDGPWKTLVHINSAWSHVSGAWTRWSAMRRAWLFAVYRAPRAKNHRSNVSKKYCSAR